jgi:hypothetical protein
VATSKRSLALPILALTAVVAIPFALVGLVAALLAAPIVLVRRLRGRGGGSIHGQARAKVSLPNASSPTSLVRRASSSDVEATRIGPAPSHVPPRAARAARCAPTLAETESGSYRPHARPLPQHGPAVPLEEIAGRAGVGVGTIYRHFATKEVLLEAVVSGRLAQLTDEARALVDAADPAGAFFDFVVRMVEEAAAKRDLLEALAGSDAEPHTQAHPLPKSSRPPSPNFCSALSGPKRCEPTSLAPT